MKIVSLNSYIKSLRITQSKIITREIKSLKELNQEERYSEKKELLISAELHVTFNKEQLTTFFNSSYIESFGDNNS